MLGTQAGIAAKRTDDRTLALYVLTCAGGYQFPAENVIVVVAAILEENHRLIVHLDGILVSHRAYFYRDEIMRLERTAQVLSARHTTLFSRSDAHAHIMRRRLGGQCPGNQQQHCNCRLVIQRIACHILVMQIGRGLASARHQRTISYPDTSLRQLPGIQLAVEVHHVPRQQLRLGLVYAAR